MRCVRRYKLFISAALFSSRKPPDTLSVPEMNSLLSPQTRIWGLVSPHYFDGLGLQMPHGRSECVKSFPLTFSSFRFKLPISLRRQEADMFVLRHIFLLPLGSIRKEASLQPLVALVGRTVKEFCSWDSEWSGPLNATALQYSASCLVSRLQLVHLTSAFLFAPAGDPQSSAVIAKITLDNCSRGNCFNTSDFHNGICTCGWMLMFCKHGDKGENIFNIYSNWLRQGAQKGYLEDYSHACYKNSLFLIKKK